MTKTKAPDWNPRSLSSFSTFGGTTPPVLEVNGSSGSHVNGLEDMIQQNGLGKLMDKTGVTAPGLVNGSGHDVTPHQPIYERLSRPDLIPTPTPVVPAAKHRHVHSKSLVGEEPIPIPAPRHAHSRSLLDEEALRSPLQSPGSDPDQRVVTLFLGTGDRRFGFSVVGGSDEPTLPRLDDIAPGSPADKADLEVGDEILEVNGKSLEDATHNEVISHIHQCIRSRTICLRVKRRTGNKLAADLAASSNVQDAFVIAVEQQARERLERLSALKKIKPVDMTKLSTQLETDKAVSSNPAGGGKSPTPTSSVKESSDNLNGVLDKSPIYVTSVPNLTAVEPFTHRGPDSVSISGAISPRTGRSRSSTPHRASSPSLRANKGCRTPTSPIPLREAPTLDRSALTSSGRKRSKKKEKSSSSTKSSSPKLTNGHHRTKSATPEAELDTNKSGDELELTQDLNDTLDDTEDLEQDNTAGNTTEDDLENQNDLSESGDSLPGTPEKTYGIAKELAQKGLREVLLDQPSHQTTSAANLEERKSVKKHTGVNDSPDSSSSRKSGGSTGSGGGRGTPKHRGGGGTTTPGKGDEGGPPLDNMISMVEFDPAHREMAVDVPESFVGRTKTPPRYPPPKQDKNSQPLSPIHNNNNNSSTKTRQQGSDSSGDLITSQNGTLPKSVTPPRAPTSPQNMPSQAPGSQEELNRIKKYEEELKVRREKEEEEAMLRSSLRSSQKLQALASRSVGSSPTPAGVVNEAFSTEEVKGSADEAPSINELIQSLQRIQTVLKSNGHRISEDMTLVAQLLTNPEFQKVLAVHNKVQQIWCLNRPPTPIAENATEILNECVSALRTTTTTTPDSTELLECLSKVSLEGLLYAHDRIAEREPIPMGTAPEEEVLLDHMTNYPDNSSVKMVRIDKTNEPLGATIRNEGDAVIIGRIVKGGAAEKSGLLHEGDEILEVNGVGVRGKSVNDVCDMLAGMTGTLAFIIIPNSGLSAPPRSPAAITIHMKAHFDYDPEEDLYIPCRELGLSFQKGDILHIMSQTDPNWWQAYRDGEEDQSLAGLVPSKTFQQQREAMRQTVVGDNNNKEKSKKGKLLCAKKHQKKKKKKMLYSNYNDDFDSEEILTYEEVGLYYPRLNRKRPVVLIGPPNIGRHELRQKLMEDRERFAAAVPHTSRVRKEPEVDGQDYHFISRTQFEADILGRKFVEHGEYEKAYYGTSLEAIRAVVNIGKICVLNLHPLALKILKHSDLKPFVVFIAPPSLEKLRQKKLKMGEPVKDEELKETIEKAREMEEQYGHYFDLIIINQDIERAYQQLLHEINMLEREPQWVPDAWLTHDQ